MTVPVVQVSEPVSQVVVDEQTNDILITESTDVLVVSDALIGPPGPQGPAGPAGDAAGALAYLHTQSAPVTVFNINHPLPFEPAGVLCIDTQGDTVEYENVSYPQPGVVALSFGVSFRGTVRLS